MTQDEAIRQFADDAQAAAAVNASPERYKPVASNAVLEWLGGNARFAKIDGWIAGTASNADANVIGLRAALRVLLLAASNPTSYLSLEPGSSHRDLLTFAVVASVIDQADADALLAKAVISQDVSVGDITARRAALAAMDARRTLNERWASVHNAVAAGIDDGSLSTWDAIVGRVNEVLA